MNVKSVAVCAFLLVIFVNAAKTRIKITDNGYSDVVVGIHPDIEYTDGEQLIDKIKELFTAGSAALYKATRKRSYFKEISILVPKKWPKRSNYNVATFETMAEADVKVQKASPLHGHGPFTVQPMSCENPGFYIHLTPTYLSQLSTVSTENYGDPGKTLVHEWAHFRYGIFDEYAELGRPEFPAFYKDKKAKEILPNACVNAKLVGRRWNSFLKRDCPINNNLPHENCTFIVDRSRNEGVTSSIASYHYLPNVYTFCDDTDEHRHNKYAPNRHNRMCNHRSTWRVITSHKDFEFSNTPREIANTVPNFKIVQEDEATISLVLDISSSMLSPSSYMKITMLYEAATRFLKEEVQIGTSVGVILFGSGARIVLPITRINNEQDRQKVINSIPTTASGMTCIGCGLRLAVQELRKFRGGSGGVIVLLSDGAENQSPTIHDVTNEVTQANIRVLTLAFTNAASPNMEKLASVTSGKTFFIPEESGAKQLDAAFHEVAAVQTTDEDLTLKIASTQFEKSSADFENTFIIDSSIGRDTAVNFVYKDRNDINDISISGEGISVSLSSPASSPTLKIEQNTLQRQIRFTFTMLPTGKYRYKVSRKGSTSQDVTVTILSKARKPGEDKIEVDCKVHEKENKAPNDAPEYIITAFVKKGTSPVINAEVVAKVDTPNGQYVLIDLVDVGKRGDAFRDDGVYSGVFTGLTGQGRYIVQATVVGSSATVIIENNFITSNVLQIITEKTDPPVITHVETGEFQRVAEAGSIQVTENFNSQTTDLYPPSRIDDLQLVSLRGKIATLEWSAPGDDLTNGQASEYDLRYTMNADLLMTQFYGRPLNGTHSPKPSGETETLQSELIGLGPGVTYYVALKARDKSGKWSDISNILEVNGV